MQGIQARFRVNWPGFELDVNLSLPARGVTALFGHSGSGKTTLLRWTTSASRKYCPTWSGCTGDWTSRLADHIVVMESGRAVATGPLSETLARLDLPIQLGEDVGVVLNAVVAERDAAWHLARVLARDVSIALQPVDGTSIQNCLSATVEDMAGDYHLALLLLRLRMGPSPLLARLTQRSAAGLGLAPGMPVWVQIKAVALAG